MSSLDIAKNYYDQSQGDCTENYGNYLKEQAKMYAMFAVVEQLQQISKALELLCEQLMEKSQ